MVRPSGCLLLCASGFLLSCSTSHPCAQGGDISWNPPLKGNKQCFQKKSPSGAYVNEGKYYQWHPNGKLALEGTFSDGQKEGVWIQYDPSGKKVAERYFENGVEKMAPVTGGAPGVQGAPRTLESPTAR